MPSRKYIIILLTIAFISTAIIFSVTDSNSRNVSEGVTVQNFETRGNSDHSPPALKTGNFSHAAIVNHSSENNQIAIHGRINSGQRSCRETYLQQATYDRSTRGLTVVIKDDFREKLGGCTSEMSLVYYEADLSLDSISPQEVTVIHRDEDNRTFSVTYNITSTSGTSTESASGD